MYIAAKDGYRILIILLWHCDILGTWTISSISHCKGFWDNFYSPYIYIAIAYPA